MRLFKPRACQALTGDCARYARMFFGSLDLSLQTATTDNFAPAPQKAMAGMLFGEVPVLADVLIAITKLETVLNATTVASSGG